MKAVEIGLIAVEDGADVSTGVGGDGAEVAACFVDMGVTDDTADYAEAGRRISALIDLLADPRPRRRIPSSIQ